MPPSSADALETNGFRPPIGTSKPALVISPILISSRRVTRPHENSRTISARFLLAFSAALTRAFDAFGDRNISAITPCSFHFMKASHTVRRWHWLDWGGRKINTSLPLTREKTSRASTEEAHVDEAHAAQQRACCRTTARGGATIIGGRCLPVVESI